MEYLTDKRAVWKQTKDERVKLLGKIVFVMILNKIININCIFFFLLKGYDLEDESDLVYDEFIENERVVKTETIEEDETAEV